MTQEDAKIISNGYTSLSQDMRIFYDMLKRFEGLLFLQFVLNVGLIISLAIYFGRKA